MIEAVPYFDLKIIKNVDKNGSTGHYAKSNCHIILNCMAGIALYYMVTLKTGTTESLENLLLYILDGTTVYLLYTVYILVGTIQLWEVLPKMKGEFFCHCWKKDAASIIARR